MLVFEKEELDLSATCDAAFGHLERLWISVLGRKEGQKKDRLLVPVRN